MRYIAAALIRFYRKVISPLTPARCKYYPTCSRYALTAVKRFGTVRGGMLAVWRILRCNPWSLGGVDYVPERFTFRPRKFDYAEDMTGFEPDSGDQSAEKDREVYEN